jgi:hypothetical protein
MPSSRDLKVMLVLGVVFTALGLGVEYGAIGSDVLLISPLLCLAVPLLGGAYVGEERLARLAAKVAARRPTRRVAAATAVAKPRRTPARVVRGGRILGTALAVRPPPAPLTV